MQRFKSAGHARRFLSLHARVNNLFRYGRHLVRAENYRMVRQRVLSTRSEITCAWRLLRGLFLGAKRNKVTVL